MILHPVPQPFKVLALATLRRQFATASEFGGRVYGHELLAEHRPAGLGSGLLSPVDLLLVEQRLHIEITATLAPWRAVDVAWEV